MNKYIRFIAICTMFSLLIIFIFGSPLYSNNRNENIDVFLILDKSLSMEKKIDPVKTYVTDNIINKLLIPGDTVTIIWFFGEAKNVIFEVIKNDNTKSMINDQISTVLGNGRFTDIGNALDVLKNTIGNRVDLGFKKYILLITDGKQEAPPTSEYYSPTGEFTHSFLENTKLIQQKGWKILILGIGSDSDTKEVADKLSSGYVETKTEEPTVKELAEKTKTFLGRIELIGKYYLSGIKDNGEASISFKIKSIDYLEAQDINIENIIFQDSEFRIKSILAEPLKISIEPNQELKLKYKVDFSGINSGTHRGLVKFLFNGPNSFQPGAFEAKIHIKNIFEKYWYLFITVAALLFYLLKNLFENLGNIFKRELVFKFTNDQTPMVQQRYRIGYNKIFYIGERNGKVAISYTLPVKLFGKLKADKKGLHLDVVNSKEFSPVNYPPDDILNKNIKVKIKEGKTINLNFELIKR